MNISLTPEQQEWLELQVAKGAIPSVEEAVRAAVDHFFPIDTDDLSWAKPYLDEAWEELERGEGIDAATVFAETDAWLKKRGG